MAETPWLTYDDFADRTGDEFRVRLPDRDPLPLHLAEVTAGPEQGAPGPGGGSRQQFTLLFRGPADPQLGQGTWDLDHDELDGLALFLVPLGPDADGPRYEAAFA